MRRTNPPADVGGRGHARPRTKERKMDQHDTKSSKEVAMRTAKTVSKVIGVSALATITVLAVIALVLAYLWNQQFG